MNKCILLIEDEPASQLIAQETLKPLGLVMTAPSLKVARQICDSQNVDLVLIDISLPDGSGFEFFSEIRNKAHLQSTVFIFATSDHDLSKKIAAFDLGVTDYIIKPYAPLELRARIGRHLRANQVPEVFEDLASGLILNHSTFKAFLKNPISGQVLDLSLTPHEFKLLNLFVRHPDQIYSRSELIDHAWGQNVFVGERTVDTHISSLRKKIGVFGENIESVRGLGYRWAFDINVPKSASSF